VERNDSRFFSMGDLAKITFVVSPKNYLINLPLRVGFGNMMDVNSILGSASHPHLVPPSSICDHGNDRATLRRYKVKVRATIEQYPKARIRLRNRALVMQEHLPKG